MNGDELQGLVTKKRIAILIVAFFLLVVAWFVFTITRSGWLEISVGSKVPSGTVVNIEITRDEPGNTPQKFSLKAGETHKVFIKKGAMRVNAEAGNIKSVDVVTVKMLSTTKLTTPQGELRAIQKLASDAQYCPAVAGARAYSYNCHGEGLVYQHHPLDSSTLDTRTVMFDSMTFAAMSPLQNGAMGVLRAEEDSLINVLKFANFETGALQDVPQDEEINALLNDEYPEVITSQDLEKSHFLLVFNRGNRAILYDSPTDTEPLILKLPENATLNDNFGITSFTLFEDRIIVYSGLTDFTDIDESPALTEKEQTYGNNVYEFDLGGKIVRTISLPKDFRSGGVRKISSDFYAMNQKNILEFYRYDGNKLVKAYSFEDAKDPLVVDGKAYVVVKGALYSFTGKSGGEFSMQSVFSSSKINMSELFNTKDGIIFVGYAKREAERSAVDVYRLLDTPQTTRPVEEVVDFDRLKNIILGYNYDDTKIIFSLRSTGFGYDYETIRLRMEAKLKELGMDVGGRRVELYPLN